MISRRGAILGGLSLLSGATACSRCASGPKVVAYTSVDQVFAEPVLSGFERDRGTRVEALHDTEETKSTGVLNRLLAEADHPRADVFWSGDPVRPFVLIRRGLVEPYLSPEASAIPTAFRAGDGTWTGTAARARVLLVHRGRAKGRVPKSVRDLAAPEWKDLGTIANPLYGTTTMHAAAWFAAWGDATAREFFDDMKRNGVRIAASNGEVKRLVIAGELAIGLTDTDDAQEAKKSGAPVDIVYPDQEGEGAGALVMPTVVTLIRGGPNPERGKALIDYLLSASVEKQMAERAAHMPLRADVEPPSGVVRVGSIRALPVDYARLAEVMERIQPWLRTWVGL